jgi:hypothetical protein
MSYAYDICSQYAATLLFYRVATDSRPQPASYPTGTSEHSPGNTEAVSKLVSWVPQEPEFVARCLINQRRS